MSKAAPLKRGLACLTCRFLKIKCDGEKPICGPCQAEPKQDECEYDGALGRSRFQEFKNTIATLQNRVRELEEERAAASSDAVKLVQPTERPQPPPQPYPWTLEDALRAASPDPSTPVTTSISTLLQVFLQRVTHLGFFLDEEHFARVALLDPDDPARPCGAVIAAACLWGCHFSPDDSPFRAVEPSILAASLHARAGNLLRGETNARRILHILQAEILLAYYFLRKGVLIEARIHTGIAVSIVRGSGMESIGIADRKALPALTLSANGAASYIPTPRNIPETGEIINGFWASYVLARHLTFLDPTVENDYGLAELHVNCPWPLDTQTYRSGILPSPGWKTIKTFLENDIGMYTSQDSAITSMTKATVLLREVSRLADARILAPHPNALALAGLASRFCDHLAPVYMEDPVAQLVYISHALSNAARLQLLAEFAKHDDQAREMCLDALHNIFLTDSECDLLSLNCVSPVLGGVWKMACLHILQQLDMNVTTMQKVHLKELYIYGRDVMVAHNTPTNVLMEWQLKSLPVLF